MSTDVETGVKEASPTSDAQAEITTGLQKGTDDLSVSQDAGGEKTDDDKSAGKGKKPLTDAERRINELWKDKRIAEQEAKKERELRIQAEKKLAEKKIAAIPKPKRAEFDTEEAYDTAHDEYVKSLVKESVQSAVYERDTKSATDETAKANEQAWAQFDQRASGLDPEKYPDFADTMKKSEGLPFSMLQSEYIRTSTIGPQMLDHFVKNPELLDRIAKMPIAQATKALDQLEQQIVKASDPKIVSKAPAPISPVGADKAKVTVDPDKMTDGEFNAWRREQKKNRFK